MKDGPVATEATQNILMKQRIHIRERRLCKSLNTADQLEVVSSQSALVLRMTVQMMKGNITLTLVSYEKFCCMASVVYMYVEGGRLVTVAEVGCLGR